MKENTKNQKGFNAMKMKIELTADELMNVVDAMMDEAIDRGYDPVDDEETADDLLAIVDAALTAMGIEITEEEEEDEDEDFDDEEEEEVDPIEELVFIQNGKRTVTKDTANMLLGMVAEAIINDDRIPDDKKWEVTERCFLSFCEEHGLECVAMNEDE